MCVLFDLIRCLSVQNNGIYNPLLYDICEEKWVFVAIVHKQSSLLYLTIPCLIQQAGTDKHIQGSETDKS